MSINVFAGARKALAASITIAVLGSFGVVAPVQAATTTLTASQTAATAKINAFTNTDWLNGVFRRAPAVSIPNTASNKTAFGIGASVRLADGQVRKVTKVYEVGSNLSVFFDGALLDGGKVGAPNSVSAGSTGTSTPSTSTGSTGTVGVVQSAAINGFTNTDWLNGVFRQKPGFSIAATEANKAAFKVGASVKLADGQVRKITVAQVVGSNMSVFVDGAAVDGSVVGAPKSLSVLGTTTSADASPAPIAPEPAPAPSTQTSTALNSFTNTDWLNGIYRKAAGFSISASAANQAAFKVGASVKLADGQVRKITRAQVVGSNMAIFVDGALLNGTTVGYPKTISVISATTTTPSVSEPSAPVVSQPAPAPVPAQPGNGTPIKLVGVNLSGAGFGPSVVPGTHGTNYIYPAESYYKKYADNGMNLVRLPFLWERIQPRLNTELNATELARLIQSLDFAQKHGVKVILDLHNYYRYFGKLIGSPEVPISAFANVWQRLAQKVLNHPAVYGYGLMNEPYSTNGLWPQAALAAAKAVRQVDGSRWIFVAGDRWSSAWHWPHYNAKLIADPWMRDPKNNLVYEAHMYIDKDFSGNYFDKSETYAPNIGIERVKPFVEWLKTNKLRGYIGEHGIPDYSSSALVAMDNLLGYLRQNCVPMTYWAGGPWWGEYALSLDVASNKYRPQLPILKKHATATSCTTIGPLM